MSEAVQLDRLVKSLLRRRMAIACAPALPLLFALALLALRHDLVDLPTVLIATVGVLALLAWRAHQRTDACWLARHLDGLDPRMEDSAALLFAPLPSLSAVQHLQRQRLLRRLAALPDPRPAWPWRTLAIALAIGLIVLLPGLVPRPDAAAPPATPDASDGTPQGEATTRLLAAHIELTPPRYTARTPIRVATLDAQAVEGSNLAIHLRLEPMPQRAALAFHDGRRLDLQRKDGQWHVEMLLDRSVLYRIESVPALAGADAALHRFDALPDQPPVIVVSRPERSLDLMQAGQASWRFEAEVRDDYGITATWLELTHARGEGEGVRFADQRIDVAGTRITTSDGSVRQRLHHTLDLTRLALLPGDELALRVCAEDNREPVHATACSGRFLLRWPSPRSGIGGALEIIARDVLPAGFRSQRQIILDSEALVAQRATLAPAMFLDRSDTIGVDQKLLRLRYGQFLGEESSAHEAHDEDTAHATNGGFGDAGDVLAQFGHVHDIAEAATLLDDATKSILRGALDAMWQAELHLRQGQPEAALPQEYRALDAIKQVQQASRIYLSRVGLELPPLDFSRRLGGTLDAPSDRSGMLTPASATATAVVSLWNLLQQGATPDWNTLVQPLQADPAIAPRLLDLLAAIDRMQRDPSCNECRDALLARLWPLLPTAATAPSRRAQTEATAHAWLDALERATGGRP